MYIWVTPNIKISWRLKKLRLGLHGRFSASLPSPSPFLPLLQCPWLFPPSYLSPVCLLSLSPVLSILTLSSSLLILFSRSIFVSLFSSVYLWFSNSLGVSLSYLGNSISVSAHLFHWFPLSLSDSLCLYFYLSQA